MSVGYWWSDKDRAKLKNV